MYEHHTLAHPSLLQVVGDSSSLFGLVIPWVVMVTPRGSHPVEFCGHLFLPK